MSGMFNKPRMPAPYRPAPDPEAKKRKTEEMATREDAQRQVVAAGSVSSSDNDLDALQGKKPRRNAASYSLLGG